LKYKILFSISILLLGLTLFVGFYALIIITGIVFLLFLTNRTHLLTTLKILFPSVAFILLLYSFQGQLRVGLEVAVMLLSSSLSFQLYFSYDSKVSLYEKLIRTGFSHSLSFVFYGVFNYAAFIRPLAEEIQNAQRLRGVEIKRGILGIIYLPILIIPLLVQVLKGSSHLAETLYLRGDFTQD